MKEVINIENLSKVYRIGQFNTGAITDDVKRWWALKTGKEDPFLKIGETNDRTKKSSSSLVWSLRDINMTVNEGDVVGIIGKNGAGKSTLLKVLSRITSPSHGSISVKGKIASLLEVGTGFHPELTGRENVFLNGAILGMRKAEIKTKFDEIVSFAGIERYIDTPVKRYSSGMYVRLAFAVAAHLDSDILIVDEVLAVGDMDFQKKCMSKMGDISKGEGRTILFVSHNMPSIKRICKSAIYLKNGELLKNGKVSDTIDYYLSDDGYKGIKQYGEIPDDFPRTINTGVVFFKRVNIIDSSHETRQKLLYLESFSVLAEVHVESDINDAVFFVIISTIDENRVLMYDSSIEFAKGFVLNKGKNQLKINCDQKLLPGNYTVSLMMNSMDGSTHDFVEKVEELVVEPFSKEKHIDYKWPVKWGEVALESKLTLDR